jgi:hypothetical protein
MTCGSGWSGQSGGDAVSEVTPHPHDKQNVGPPARGGWWKRLSRSTFTPGKGLGKILWRGKLAATSIWPGKPARAIADFEFRISEGSQAFFGELESAEDGAGFVQAR